MKPNIFQDSGIKEKEISAELTFFMMNEKIL